MDLGQNVAPGGGFRRDFDDRRDFLDANVG